MKHLTSFSACTLLAALAVAPACRAQDPVAPAPPSAPAAAPAPIPVAPTVGSKPQAGNHARGGEALPFGMGMPGMEAPDPETLALQKEFQKMQVKAQLRQLKLQEELAAVTEEINGLQTKMTLNKARHDAAQAAAMDEVNRAQEKIALEKAQREVARAAAQADDDRANFELNQKLAESKRKNQELQAQIEALSTASQLEQTKLSVESKRLQTVLAVKEIKEKAAESVLGDEVVHADEPFKDGVLTITDRRVALNGLIWEGSVRPAIDKIQFFANQSTKPIFLVIDESPGGSVASGEQVIKAMESSKAPVYVVVKSFAASMAACICTLAPHSYAYPNAVILHHQISYGGEARQNLTQHRERLDQSTQWYKRLSAPIAKKMGLSVEDMVKEMYKKNSDGNWMEFADEAQKLHWVDAVADEVREIGVRELPKGQSVSLPVMLKEQQDSSGRFVQLPRLETYDCWLLDNQDGYYRN